MRRPDCKQKQERLAEVEIGLATAAEATTPATCVGHGWTFWQSVGRKPVVLLPALLCVLLAGLYIYRGTGGVYAWVLLVVAPVLLFGTWRIVMRGLLCPVVILYGFEHVPFIEWQWWPKAVADLLPDTARWIYQKKPVYALDRWNPADTGVRAFEALEPETISKPELTAGFTQLADVQTVNTDHKGGLRREIIKKGMLIGIMIGLGLADYVIATKIMGG